MHKNKGLNFLSKSVKDTPLYQSPPGQLSLLLIVPAEELRAQQRNMRRVVEGVIRARRGSVPRFL